MIIAPKKTELKLARLILKDEACLPPFYFVKVYVLRVVFTDGDISVFNNVYTLNAQFPAYVLVTTYPSRSPALQ